jgi:WXG100 family type VII secretion target
MLKVDPEVLESEATNIEGLATQFGGDLDARERAVEGLDWDGATHEAFVAMFSEARTQFRDVEEQLANIASTLRSAKDGLIEADASIGQSIGG